MPRFFAISLMPLLARVLLALALAPSGYRDAFDDRVFSPQEVATLVSLGLDLHLEGVPPGATVDPESLDPQRMEQWLGKALELHELHVQHPIEVARWESVTRLVGGTLLLIGFLSRLWAAVLLIDFGAQFALGPAKDMAKGLFYGLEPAQYSEGFLSLALCVLALNVLLVGSGALSIDRAVFGGTSRNEDA